MLRIAIAALAWAACHAFAFDRLATLETRPGVTIEYWRMERDGAAATLVLLPGGDGGLSVNAKRGGVPGSHNFLVRTRDDFAAAGFNVVVMGKPGDKADLDAEFRTSPEHIEDVRRMVELARREFGKPVWLVGTSRGTISAAAAAIALQDSIAGLVLTSSVTNGNNTVPVPSLELQKIRVPVLVMHHKQDECRICQPDRAPRIVERLKNAPTAKLLMVEGGSGARGNPCEAQHWHGYIGMEREAVAAIVSFVRNPAP